MYATEVVLAHEASSEPADHHEHSSSVGTLPSSPTASPSFVQKQSHLRPTKQQQIHPEIDTPTSTSSPRASSASSSAPMAQSTEELQLADASQPASSHLSASFRPTQTFSSSRHSQSTPSRSSRAPDFKVNTPSSRQPAGANRPTNRTRPLRDLEDPPSPPRSRSQTSPHPPTPRPTPSSSSTTTWSTLTSRSRPSIIPRSSAYGSGLEGISATSAATSRFALPEFAPQGGGMPMVVRERAAAAAVGQQQQMQQMQQNGTPLASRMAFKPTESLGAFKARVAREKAEVEARGGGQVEREEGERLLFGANMRSVKAGTVVSVGVGKGDDEGQKEGGGSLYRDFSW